MVGRSSGGPVVGTAAIESTMSMPRITSPKTVLTKLIHIPVTIGANDANVDFTHIEEGLSFPMLPAGATDPYLIYIGFDPLGAAAQEQAKKPAPAKKPKPTAKPNPNAPTG